MKFIDKLKLRIRNWYLGEFVKNTENWGDIGYAGGIRRPRLAIFFDWCCKEYKWLIGVIISLLLIYLAWRKK